MERQAAIEEIRGRWREIYPAAKVKGQIICPLCGHGTHGDGIKENPKAKNKHSLKCFGCEFSGDVLDLIQQERGCSFNEALLAAADQLGIAIDRAGAPEGAQRPVTAAGDKMPGKEIKQPQRAAESAKDYTDYYQECAKRIEDPEADAYLTARGISQETAFLYGLGYDPAWISPAAVKKLEAEGNPWRPAPTKRIIIPVSRNHYVARAMDPAVEKYAKPNETGGGSAGIFNEKALYSEAKVVFVTEGAFDALSVIEAGAAAVALNSTNMVSRFLEGLRARPTKAVLVICLDTDDKGKKAADQLRQGLDLLGILYITKDISGGHKDPNEALTGDWPSFMERVKQAEQLAEKVRPASVIDQFLEKIQGEAYRPYKTGLTFFDNLLGGGVLRQTLLLLLAAPGAGKTTLCQQVAEALARNGNPVIYLNFEMSREQMIAKALSGRSFRRKEGGKYSVLEILQGYKWTDKQRSEITADAAAYEREILTWLKYNPGGLSTDVDALQGYLDAIGNAAHEAGGPAPVLIVDYLHLITSKKRLEARELIRQAVYMLKEYAVRNNTFVMAIAASNRDSNKGVIGQDSGRDSSNIEYTADYLLSLNYYAVEKDEVDIKDPVAMGDLQQKAWREMTLRVNKSRFTAPGRTANLYFHAAGNTFYGEGDWMPADPERVPFTREKERRKRL